MLISSTIVSAENNDFEIGTISVKTPASYQDSYAVMKVRITSLNSVCDQSCSWSATGGDAGTFDLVDDDFYSLEFNSNAKSGQGSVNGVLDVSCSEEWYCGGSDSGTQSFSHSYPFLGDGQCETTNNREDCTNAKSDCTCSSGKSCIDDKGDSSRSDLDSRKCATYCGNGIKESPIETCLTCQSDVGKCDGIPCNSGGECEGSYCVHGKCWNEPYKVGDGSCDLNEGEDCKNSVADCACGNNERCGSQRVCETWCGNNVCESFEAGKCEADCQWCGDGECDSSKGENCNSCDSDCGVCEDEEYNQELQTQTQDVISEGLKSSSQKQKIISYSAIGLILLVILGYIGFKFILSKKAQSKIIDKVEKDLNIKKTKSKRKTKKKKSKKKK